MKPFSFYLSAAATTAALFLTTSCGTSDTASPPPSSNAGSTQLVYADDWTKITIQANFAKTLIDLTGHFSTSRNACGQDAAGALEIGDWNTFARDINSALKARGTTKTCVAPSYDDPAFKMDGNASIEMANGETKELVELVNGEFCASVSDVATVRRLLKALNVIVLMADKEACPNGWGSG